MDYSFAFILKKMVSGLLQPLPLFLILMAMGVLILWLSRWQKTGKILISISWLSLLLLSLQPVADTALYPLESHYPTYELNSTTSAPTIRYIVVLGGGHVYNPAWAPSSTVLSNSLPRIVEGIRLQRLHPDSQLIFTGAAAQNNRTAAASAEAIALSLGVPASAILRADTPNDTEEEAQAVKAMIDNAPFILVTSANHLPRAMQIFEAAGLSPLPAPANQMAITTPLAPWEKWLPSSLALSHSERVWREYMGQAWQAVK